MKKMPDYLYHYSPKENRLSILENGLIGSHNGGWCIYLAENPNSWKVNNSDCWKVSTKNLDCMDFTSVDEGIDEDRIGRHQDELPEVLAPGESRRSYIDDDELYMNVELHCYNTNIFQAPRLEEKYREEFPNAKY